MGNLPVNLQLVEKLTTILEQAKSGELIGFTAITFRRNSDPDQWAVITRREDMDRLPNELEKNHALKRTANQRRRCKTPLRGVRILDRSQCREAVLRSVFAD